MQARAHVTRFNGDRERQQRARGQMSRDKCTVWNCPLFDRYRYLMRRRLINLLRERGGPHLIKKHAVMKRVLFSRLAVGAPVSFLVNSASWTVGQPYTAGGP